MTGVAQRKRTVVLLAISFVVLAVLVPPLGRVPTAEAAAQGTLLTDSMRAAVEAILRTHEREWNRHDMNAWATILHEDADWVNWRGGYWHGKAAIKAGHEAIHRTYYRQSRLSAQRIEDMTALGPDIVLVHARGELSGDERAPGQVFQYRKTIVITRQGAVWRIRALHNTRLDGVN